MNGILNVNKEKGMTSFDVIAKIKRILKIKKIGHAGTLDPLATGVLVVLLGDATKLSNYLMNEIKEYKAKIIIGISTDTEDSYGKIVETKKVDVINNIDKILSKMIGKLGQTPPMYSAIKVEGKKLYELARLGKVIEREEREIIIYDIKRTTKLIYQNDACEFEFTALVSKGTYIRTLCVEIGERLGYPAHMSELVRTKSGSFNIEDSYTLNDIENGKYNIVSMLESLKNYSIIDVDDDLALKVKNGIKLSVDQLNTKEELVVIANSGNLLGIYKKYNNEYKAERIWN